MELFHDHEMVRNVEYESLWDNLGMSDIKGTNKMYCGKVSGCKLVTCMVITFHFEIVCTATLQRRQDISLLVCHGLQVYKK